jgi:hypothetical protein
MADLRREETEPVRGVTPRILIDQVRNTAPFIFAPEFSAYRHPYIRTLRGMEQTLQITPDPELTFDSYYELCLSAHHGTVGTFVPTDVDNQIRQKLWNPNLPSETLAKMARTVMDSASWDPRPVSTRVVTSPDTGEYMSGHNGEWFSTAAGAYGAFRKRDSEIAAELGGMIVREMQREAQIYRDFKSRRDGIGMLKAATVIAHNLGDLDRVLEAWNVPDEDPLKEAVHKAGHERPERFGGTLVEAGALNKAYMADENHRNFALRKPKCLRNSPDYLIPIGPFFDDWGAKLARHPGLTREELGEIVEALADGWERLQKPPAKPFGYARALAGIIENFPGGPRELANYIPTKLARTLKAGALHTLISIPKDRFEKQWNQMALNFARH